MKLTAKEMFKSLGYEYCKYYDRNKIIQYYNEKEDVQFLFWIEEQEFSVSEYGELKNITVDEFKAIQQQLKELGWLEEETCTNESEYNLVDGFECSNCGIIIENYNEIEIDEDCPEDRCMKEYAPRYCPNCGKKIVD